MPELGGPRPFCKGGVLAPSASGRNLACQRCGRIAVSKGARGKERRKSRNALPVPLAELRSHSHSVGNAPPWRTLPLASDPFILAQNG